MVLVPTLARGLLERYGPDGAGDGKVSLALPLFTVSHWLTLLQFVGLKVPLANVVASPPVAPGRPIKGVAASDNVMVRLLTFPPGESPPTSDQMSIFAPVGPTSSMSTSAALVWLKPVIVTVRLVILFGELVTLMIDG